MFCQVEPEEVVQVVNVNLTYRVPMLLEEQNLLSRLTANLQLDQVQMSQSLVDRGQKAWVKWKNLVTAATTLHETVRIVLVGKYLEMSDSYFSVTKSLEHAAMHCGRKLVLEWVDASDLELETQNANTANYHIAWGKVCTAK